MRRMPQKWYNMQQINMSNGKSMGSAAKQPRGRCSAAYPTGRERIAKGLPYNGVSFEPIVYTSSKFVSSQKDR